MKPWLYTILINLLTAWLYGYNELDISISKITPEGGVAYSQVNSIIEDNEGFIWFSTNNGLFLYNSTEIKRYSYSQNDSLTISTNRINQLYKDDLGRIWVATENGLCTYNSNDDNFNRYSFKDQYDNNIGINITSLFQDNNKNFWFSDENGLGTLDLKNNKAVYKKINDNTNYVNYFTADENGNLWVFYDNGEIYYLPKNSNSFQFFAKSLNSHVSSVLFNQNYIWIAYETDGLVCIDLKTNKQIHHFNSENTEVDQKLPHNQVRSLAKDENNLIWVATFNGIAIIKNFKVEYIVNKRKHPELPTNSIWSLFKDSNNNIWIGTWLGGLALHSKFNNSFFHYNESTSKNSLSGNIVSCFTQIPNKNEILIGLDDGVTNKFNLKTKLFTPYPIVYKRDTLKNIKSLAYDKYETLWVGTYGKGVFIKKKDEKSFKPFLVPFKTGFQALSILPTDEGVWVSDYPLGVYFYSFDSKKVIRFQHNPFDNGTITNNNVNHVIQDKKGNIWIATKKGLNVLRKGSSKFINYFHEENNSRSISNCSIYFIHEDLEGFLWLGTNGEGLIKLNSKTQNYRRFTKKDGLSGNEVFSILEDNNKNLWITTENGITKLNTSTNTIQSYLANKGIWNNHFNPVAALVSENQDLLFGGTNGFLIFEPKKIIKNLITPKTSITDILVNNEKIKFKNEKKIKLDYTQNSINIGFTSNNFIHPQKNKFKYRLLGFKDQWIETGVNGKASFINIPPGNYNFQVNAANNDGIWSELPSQIYIEIIPPIWKRWYAYFVYLLMFLLFIYFIRNQYVNKQKLKSEIIIGKIQRENEEKLHKMKMEFFTNVSHEFRTPLTLIDGPVNRLLRADLNNELFIKQLKLIKNNTNRLLRLINQFLDFRRADHGTLRLSCQNVDIVSFCKDVFNCFEEHANFKNYDYNFKSDFQSLKIDFDTDKIDKVLVNILSNAFKYSAEKDNITLKIQFNEKPLFNPNWKTYTIGDPIEDDFVSISISDSGEGISAKMLPLIFERFFQSENNYNKGTGIGLSLSVNYILLHGGQLTVSSLENKGSVFSFCIPQIQLETNSENVKINTDFNSNEPISESANDEIGNPIDFDDHSNNKEALILIVEDNLELLDFLGDILSDHFRVGKAKNGKEAYNQIYALSPEIVISDIMMPEMDGIELCQKIKNDIMISHIPVILLTSLDTVKDRIESIKHGADVYISKPFNEDILIAQINNLLNSRKALRSLYSTHKKAWDENIQILDLDKMFLQKAINVVEKNINNTEFSVENLAKNLHISRTHLHRKLTSLTDQSATEFIRNIRLTRAIKLMKQGKFLVNEIGYAVGFNSHNYFTKSFKKQFGKSPKEFMDDNLWNTRIN